jgi:hypothetical protein
MFFLFALTEKKRGKIDVAMLIVTGFSLQVTLARYRVEVVYLRDENWVINIYTIFPFQYFR